MIARFLSNGKADGTFGDNGLKVVHFGAGHDRANAVAVTPDGKIVVAGTVFNGWVDIWGLLRLTSAGQPDPTFGANHDGKAFVHPKDLTISDAHAVVVQPDKKIVVAGHINFNAAIARLEESGLPDAGFGTAGLTTKDFGGNDGINALVLAPTGWLYTAGSRFSSESNTNDFALAQFRPDGKLAQCTGSTSCGYWSTGTAFVNFGGNDIAYALDWRRDDQLVAAGFSDGRFVAAQFSATQAVPSPLQFSTDFPGNYEVGTGVKFIGSDKLVLAGLQNYNDDWNIALARFQTKPINTALASLAPMEDQPTQEPQPVATEQPTQQAAEPTTTEQPTATAEEQPTATVEEQPTEQPTQGAAEPTATEQPTATAEEQPSEQAAEPTATANKQAPKKHKKPTPHVSTDG